MSSPVELANALQSLVTSTYNSDGATVSSSYDSYVAKHAISDLCLQLLRRVQGPEEYTAILAESCQESSALNLVVSTNVADHIADSPKGQLSLTELSEMTGANIQYLSVALSTLLYHGYFDQVAQDTFANNEFSNVLRDPLKTQGSKTVKDAVGLSADDGARAAAHIVEAATQQWSESGQKRTALNFAHDTTLPIFQWMSQPGNEWRGQRTGRAMVQLHAMANGGTAEDFPWEGLATPIIDVGGGIGSFAQILFTIPKNKDLKFIIFDIEKTIGNARKAWAAKPQWMQDQVSFVSGDFMISDPEQSKIPTNGGTYVIRHVLHDWDDTQVVTILENVHNAIKHGLDPSRPKPRFLLVEMLLTPTSSRFTHTTSMQLLSLSGGITRTEAHMRMLVEKAELKVDQVTMVRGVDLIMEVGL